MLESFGGIGHIIYLKHLKYIAHNTLKILQLTKPAHTTYILLFSMSV